MSRQNATQVSSLWHFTIVCHAMPCHAMLVGREAVNPNIFGQGGPVVCNSGACAIYSSCVMMSYALGCQPSHIRACVPPVSQALISCSERFLESSYVYPTHLNVLAGAEHKLLKLASLIHMTGAGLVQQNRTSNTWYPLVACLPLVNNAHAFA